MDRLREERGEDGGTQGALLSGFDPGKKCSRQITCGGKGYWVPLTCTSLSSDSSASACLPPVVGVSSPPGTSYSIRGQL